ncbi:Alpha-galactosidase [Aphelenchoides bicaudatus]|nr:Alpha-galactosidase [Aphelenchoides bicaudatus]
MTKTHLFALFASIVAVVNAVNVTLPPIHGRFDYQIGGPYKPKASVKIVDRDHSVSPVSGLYNLCYVNAFQTQPEQKKMWKTQYPDLLLKTASGKLVQDPGWPGEFMLDTRTNSSRDGLFNVVKAWIDECAQKGFQAIEPDNLDSYSRSKNLITKQNNLDFAKMLANYSHSLGLAFGQKNDASITTTERDYVGFDYGIVEECQKYKECPKYDALYGDRWIEIEYTNKAFKKACKKRGKRVSIIRRDRDVVKRGKKKYVYKVCK